MENRNIIPDCYASAEGLTRLKLDMLIYEQALSMPREKGDRVSRANNIRVLSRYYAAYNQAAILHKYDFITALRPSKMNAYEDRKRGNIRTEASQRDKKARRVVHKDSAHAYNRATG